VLSNSLNYYVAAANVDISRGKNHNIMINELGKFFLEMFGSFQFVVLSRIGPPDYAIVW